MTPDRAATVALGLAVPPLLIRMRRDFEQSGSFSRSTAAAMWACYGLGGGLYAHALRRGQPAPPTIRALGLAASAAGVAGVAAGMRAFDSVEQVSGTQPGDLHERGVYRYSRNPQYAGFVLAAAGGALARRSAPAGALAAAYATVCTWWVRVEERTLRRTFGDNYDGYQQSAPRWIGFRLPDPPPPEADNGSSIDGELRRRLELGER
jgi:protein-S-isoprenylcysteine O-methyltransferase Ste14